MLLTPVLQSPIWEQIIYWGQVAGAFTAISIAAWGTYFYAVKPYIIDSIIHMYNVINDMHEQMKSNFNTLQKTLPVLTEISLEFKPNHGSSLRDSINRIEDSLYNLQTVDRLLLNKTDEAHFQTNEKGECVWVNKSFCELVGSDVTDILRQGWEGYIDPADRDNVIKEWKSCLKEKRQFNMKFNYLALDGVHIKVHVHSLINVKNGKMTGSIGTITPIA